MRRSSSSNKSHTRVVHLFGGNWTFGLEYRLVGQAPPAEGLLYIGGVLTAKARTGAPGAAIPVEHAVEQRISEAHERARLRFACPQLALQVFLRARGA
jgi:hypothetical protein